MKKKLMKNLILIVTLAVLCFAVGVTVSAYYATDVFEQGYATSEQTLLSFNLNGGTMAEAVEVLDINSGTFETVNDFTGMYIMVPKTEDEQKAGTYIILPKVTAPDLYRFDGWYCYADAKIYVAGSAYHIPEGYGGIVIDFYASYSPDDTPYNIVDGRLTAGENLTWTFDETTGTLTISGEGPMYDFVWKDRKNYVCPWEEFRGDIYNVTINEGVTSIGESAFENCYRLKKVVLPESIKVIGECSFLECLGLTEVIIPKNIESIADEAFVVLPFLEKVIVKSLNVNLGELSLCADAFAVSDMSRDDFVDLFSRHYNGEISYDELEKHIEYSDVIFFIGTIYCHSGSTAEAYAIENGVDYVLTHFFEGDWTYDYDNMIRFRKCIHCDDLETEQLETTGDSDVDIIAPVDPDTDFTVDVITDYVVIEETISNNITTDFEIVKAFDITMKNKDGVHVQPDGTVKVKLPLDWSKDGVYKVYRVNDDGTLTDMNAYREGSHMVFDTDHFSVYVIVDESEKADTPAETPEEETKNDFFSKIIDLIKSFFNLILSWFSK